MVWGRVEEMKWECGKKDESGLTGGRPERISTSLSSDAASTSTTGSVLTLRVVAGFSLTGDGDDSRFLFPRCGDEAGVVPFAVWRENSASMPSLRFSTGSMNVGDSTPTLPTSCGTA